MITKKEYNEKLKWNELLKRVNAFHAYRGDKYKRVKNEVFFSLSYSTAWASLGVLTKKQFCDDIHFHYTNE